MSSTACLTAGTESSVTSEDDVNSVGDLPQHDIKPPANLNAGVCSSPSLNIREMQKYIKGSRVKCFSSEHLKPENSDDQLRDAFVAINKQEPLVETVRDIVAKKEEMNEDMNEEMKEEMKEEMNEEMNEETNVTQFIETGDVQNPSNQPYVENVAAAGNLSSDHKPTSRRKTTEMQCTECTFQCTSGEKLKMHVSSVHEQGESYSCCLCSFESKWNREYYKHMRTHFPGPPYQCDFKNCAAKCERIQHLLYHRMNHTEERPFSCCFCPLRFKIKSTMLIHLRKHTGCSPFTCSECSRSFSTKGALQQHAVTHSDKRAFLCDQCGFSTKHQSHLISHRRIHAGDVLQCQLENCSYKTTKRSQLLAHMQSHLRIKTFFCDQCGQGFVAKSHLKRHELTHIANKPFTCDFCDYSSNRKDKLRLHVMKHHGVNSNLATDVRSKQKTVHSSRNTRCSESEAPEVDNDATSCVKFQKMVQKVDEQLNNRRLTKYTKVPHVEQGGMCSDLSNSMDVESSETIVVEDQLAS